MIRFLITLLLVVTSSVSSQVTVCYVVPDNSSSSCPGQPCLTLDQYASQQTKYVTAGATFMFLAGNHTSTSSVLLHDTSNISLKAMDSDFDVIVVCKTVDVIQFIDSANLTIQGVTFVFDTEAAHASSIIKTAYSKDILFINSVFLGNSDAQVRAVYCDHSDIAIVRSKFKGNIGDYGGAVYAEYCNLTISNSKLNENTAENHGGAIYAPNCNLTIDSSAFYGNTGEHGGAIAILESNLIIDSSVFNGNTGDFGGAIAILESNLTIDSSAFSGNTGDRGGAIAILKSNLTIDSNVFNGNTGDYGGAVYAQQSIFTINNNSFNDNIAEYNGGAIAIFESKLTSVFNSENFTSIFYKNTAQNGGAIHSFNSSFLQVVFTMNSTFPSNAKLLYFTDNVAIYGGGIYSWSSNLWLFSASFTNNTCVDEGYGGALFSLHSNISLHDFNATKNCRAVATVQSTVSFTGNVMISRNYGKKCGGISTQQSTVYFTGHTVFEGNHVSENGGAVCTQIKSTLSLSGTVLFHDNHACTTGGAIYAFVSTTILIEDNVSFIANSAEQSGGAFFFESGARLSLKQNLVLTLTNNHADRYGGAVCCEDTPTTQQCENYNLPVSCFIEFFSQTSFIHFPYKISARNNSANIDGSFLYGGLLDKCNVFISAQITHYIEWHSMEFYPIFLNMTAEQSDATLTQQISSRAYQLCFCKGIQEYNCTEEQIDVNIQRGRKFIVRLIALAQGDTVVSSPVRARIKPTARLLPDQRSQYLPGDCTSLQFNMYSSQEQELLILYLDESPCLDTGSSLVVINVTFLPCPDGFTLSGDQCVCEERLQKYHAYCTIFDEEAYITKKAGSTFWLSPLNSSNETYLGLILYPACPKQYCKTDNAVNISLIDPNIQCAHNRSGVLCGACAANYSLTFGSSCEICSDIHLALLLAFAAAGLVLVVFLTLLRLTVATGLINSVILYTNIVQTNRDVLFPNSSAILKIFIAWMNFDFGFQTCFYDGMDAYTQTWLQFAFPVYVWILISLIILASRYSMTVTKLIGSNPIAVLATLLLMSYTKLLKIIIEVYSSVNLEYPENKSVTVWLNDANEPYLQSRHLALTVVTTVFLFFFFLPYTLLLLLGYKLYRFTGRRYNRWLMRIKPLLDSYYAPYKMHTRFWTGFLLLIRCALYIMFSYNSLGHTSHSLLAIIIAFATIIVWLTVKVYSKLLKNTLEGVVYLNLIILCAVAQVKIKSSLVVNSLVGMVLVITIGVIIYHFHILYIAKSALWLKLRAQMTALRAKPAEATPLLAPVASGASPQGTLAAIATPPRREPTRSVLFVQT